ncbi:MAG: hypothetical protein HY812_00990 [Planctomycetes bacterium]|nr:hypothetical protein [Planctomycetota bacterium]
MFLLRALASFSLLCPLLSCTTTPPQRNPLQDAKLLAPATFQAAVNNDATLNILPLQDERGLSALSPSAAERDMSIATVDLVLAYLEREIRRAGSFADVRAQSRSNTDLEMLVRLEAFSGWTEGSPLKPCGLGSVAFVARVTRRADGAVLLERRYCYHAEETQMFFDPPDTLALACEALRNTTDELLVDLERLDLGGAAPGAP